MLKAQSAKLDRKKLFGDPVLITTIVILVILLTLFILYPLSMLLIDSVWGDNGLTLSVFGRVLEMGTFRTAFTNTLRLGFIVGIGSTVLGLLFAYVDVYVDIRSRWYAAVRRGEHAARGFSTLRAEPEHDSALRTQRPHHAQPAAHLRRRTSTACTALPSCKF